MLLDIAIIVFLMVAAILLILAEIFLLPGITLAGIGGGIFFLSFFQNLRCRRAGSWGCWWGLGAS